MTLRQVVTLAPCPFCEGPPVAVCVHTIGRTIYFPIPEEGTSVDAHVFCHECGGQGPNVSGWVFDRAECDDLTAQAIAGWNERHARSRDLYDHSARDGLNAWPRRAGGPAGDSGADPT